ncbi:MULTISPECIES: hypothetical protein [unclassified Amycolatopsis]|uniref:hypothetical protein n=1 Tax=unclassified Amycolatopsis TaxID=2618356 RepID=UPI001FF54FBA|nr:MULTISPECIES: hypothetical protein [unclassified Amycolatopsis]UOZ03259.1 hypothetical protein MUY22_30915 [Amycolatopsis sp. WQ 127309]
MTDQFFVDADGLDTGRNGYREKATELEALTQRIQALGSSGRVSEAAGHDKNGNAFAQTHMKAVAEIRDGVRLWAKAVDGTSDAIHDMAGSFREADQGAFDMARDLQKNFLQLQEDVSKPPASS